MIRRRICLKLLHVIFSKVLLIISISFIHGFWVVPVMALNSEIQGPIVSDPVAPGVSREVARIPIRQLMRSQAYQVHEVPRRRDKAMTGGDGTDPAGALPGTEYRRQSLNYEGIKKSSRSLGSSSFIGISFDGMDIEDGGFAIPSDPVGDVGPNHYV